MAKKKNKKYRVVHPRENYQWGNPYVIGTILVRVIGILSMFLFPWWGLIATMILDVPDAWVLIQKAGYSRTMYHMLDKWIDWFSYFVEYCIVLQTHYVLPFTALLIFRFIGQYLFIKTKKTMFFILTPNIYEVCFLWFIAAPSIHITDTLSVTTYWYIFIGLVCVKYMQEIWLHLVWPWYLKCHGYSPLLQYFGYRRTGFAKR